MQADDDQEAEAWQEDVQKDAGEAEGRVQGEKVGIRTKTQSMSRGQDHSRLSVQSVFSLSNGDCLVKNSVLENISLQKESGFKGQKSVKKQLTFKNNVKLNSR